MKEPAKDALASKPDHYVRGWIVVTVSLLIPVFLCVGFGYLSWSHGLRLKTQNTVDRDGVNVTVKIKALEIKDGGHRSARSNVLFFISPPNQFCELIVSYQAKSPERSLNKLIVLEDDAICRNHQVGDILTGRILPEHPKVLVLDENRLETMWIWVVFLLVTFFSSIPIYFLLRRFNESRLRKNANQIMPG